MAASNHVENPFEYLIENLTRAVSGVFRGRDPAERAAARVAPQIRRLEAADLRDALKKGLGDFAAARDDVVFIAIVYPIAGLGLALLAMRNEMLPMIFPLVSGFALVGPLAAVGLYEISRRREAGENVSWTDAVRVFGSPALGTIVQMGLILMALLVLWLGVAYEISLLAFSNGAPESLRDFVNQVLSRGAGLQMAVVGIAVGFLFALVAMAISVVSFPLLLDRHLDVDVAILTSLRVVARNPGIMALWGLIVATALAIGALPALMGLIVVLPVLGHATWHLYRRAVEPEVIPAEAASSAPPRTASPARRRR